MFLRTLKASSAEQILELLVLDRNATHNVEIKTKTRNGGQGRKDGGVSTKYRREGKVGCGHMRLFNRESPRIFANRIILAPSCSAPAYACKPKVCVPPQMGFACAGIARRLEKCCRKNRRAGFSFIVTIIQAQREWNIYSYIGSHINIL